MVSYCSETPVTEVEENESESVPFLTCPMTETLGLMAEKTSEFSSYSSYISSASTVREEPRPVTETVSVFVPMSSNIEVTSPVMPCSVAVFTIGLMLAFSEQVNIVLAMFLCHWALIGLSKVYFFGIPEDYLLACSTVPALYIFFREYVRSNADRPTKPSAHVLDALLIALSLVVGIFFTVTLLHQLDLFTQII